MPRRIFLVVAVAVVSMWPAAASAQVTTPVQPSSQVVLSGDVVVPRGTVAGEVVVFSGSATIGGVAQDDVVVLEGPVTVTGQVGGDVIALHGPIRLARTAQVSGDVLAGGGLDVAEGAEVAGSVRHDVGFTLAGPVGVLGALLVSVAMAASILVCGLGMLLLAPRGAERAADAARSAPLATAGWGLLLAIVLPVAALALGVTVLGLPLALSLLLGLGLLWFVGVAVTTFALGRRVIHAPRSRIASLVVGCAIVGAIGLVPVLNAIVWTLAGIFGFGAVIVATWRARSGRAPAEPGQRAGRHRAPRRPSEPAQPPVSVGAASSSEQPTDIESSTDPALD